MHSSKIWRIRHILQCQRDGYFIMLEKERIKPQSLIITLQQTEGRYRTHSCCWILESNMSFPCAKAQSTAVQWPLALNSLHSLKWAGGSLPPPFPPPPPLCCLGLRLRWLSPGWAGILLSCTAKMFSTPVALGWKAAWWPADGLPLHATIPLSACVGMRVWWGGVLWVWGRGVWGYWLVARLIGFPAHNFTSCMHGAGVRWEGWGSRGGRGGGVGGGVLACCLGLGGWLMGYPRT